MKWLGKSDLFYIKRLMGNKGSGDIISKDKLRKRIVSRGAAKKDVKSPKNRSR